MADERRQAKADAKAQKSREKALRPWYKKKRFIIPLGLLALIILISVGSGGDDGDPGETIAADDVPEEVPEEASEARMGEAATDGQFTFTVTGFECGETTIGEDPFHEEAQGQFCLLDVTVENTGTEARGLSADNQYLYDDEERQFSSDITYAFAIDTPIYEEINPGNSIQGTIVFDVPQDANIVFAELHDSPFSGGVLVSLNS